MVAVRYCDHCGVRLPLDFSDGDTYLCPSCGKPVEPEPSPEPPSQLAKRKTKPRMTPPPVHGSGRHPTRGSKRKTPPRGQSKRHHGDVSQSQRGQARNANTVIIVLAALAGLMLTLAVMLLTRGPKGGAKKKKVPPSSEAPAPGGVSSAAGTAMPGVVDSTPVADAGVGAVDGQVGRGGSALFGKAAPGQGGDDDFFANLRQQSETRRQDKQADRERRLGAFEAVFGPEWKMADGISDSLLKESPLSHAGRQNTVTTHPYARNRPFAFEREATIPEAGTTELVVTAAPRYDDAQTDWMLVIKVDGVEIGKERVGPVDGRVAWQTFTFDLSRFGGRTVKLRIENASGGRHGWRNEHGHWAEVRIVTR